MEERQCLAELRPAKAVNVATTPHEESSNKPKAVAQSKGHGKQNSRTEIKKPDDTNYLENAIPPQAIILEIQRAYDEFKVWEVEISLRCLLTRSP